MNDLPKRQTPAKGVHIDPDQPTILWVTVCSKARAEWLAQDPVMKLLHSVWLTDATAWLVGDYLLMPDHVHFFCGLRDSRVTVEHWIAYWKDRFAKGHSLREHGYGKEASFIIASDRFRSIVRSGPT